MTEWPGALEVVIANHMSLLLFFEVIDKEPSIVDIWIVFASIGILGFALSCWKRAFAAAAIGTSLLFFSILAAEFHDPQVNDAIWKESPLYLPQFYFSALFSIMLPIFGAGFCPRTAKSRLP